MGHVLMTVELEHGGVVGGGVVVGTVAGADVAGGSVVLAVVALVAATCVVGVLDGVPPPHPVRVNVTMSGRAAATALIRPLLVIDCMLRSADGRAASPLPDLAR
jgi:hypothetical protein